MMPGVEVNKFRVKTGSGTRSQMTRIVFSRCWKMMLCSPEDGKSSLKGLVHLAPSPWDERYILPDDGEIEREKMVSSLSSSSLKVASALDADTELKSIWDG